MKNLTKRLETELHTIWCNDIENWNDDVEPGWKSDYSLFEQWALENGWQHGLVAVKINDGYEFSPINCKLVTKPEKKIKAEKRKQWAKKKKKCSMYKWMSNKHEGIDFYRCKLRVRVWEKGERLTIGLYNTIQEANNAKLNFAVGRMRAEERKNR